MPTYSDPLGGGHPIIQCSTKKDCLIKLQDWVSISRCKKLFTIFLLLQNSMQFGQIWIFYPRLDSNMKENINKRSHHLPPPYLPPTSTTFQKSWKCQVSTTFACFCWININLWTKMANIRPGRDYRENFPPEYNIPQILVRQTHLEFQYLSKDFHHWATWQEKPPWGPSSCPPQEPKLEADPIRNCRSEGGETFI